MKKKITPPGSIPERVTPKKSKAKAGAGYVRGSGKTGRRNSRSKGTVDKPTVVMIEKMEFEDERELAISKLDNPRKRKMLRVLPDVFFNKTEACRLVGVTQPTIYNWLKNDPAFKELYDYVFIGRVDLVEAKLMANIMEGKGADIRYFLDRQAIDRGYGQKVVIDQTVKSMAFDPADLTDAELNALLDKLTESDTTTGDAE